MTGQEGRAAWLPMLGLGFALFGTLPAPSHASTFHDPTPAERRMAEDPAHGITGAVYLEKAIETDGQNCRTYVRAKVFSRSGFDVGAVEGLSANAYDVEGRTISPTGAVTKLPSSDVHTTLAVKTRGRTLKETSFTLPALEPGCIIEYSYREPGTFGSRGDAFVELLFQDKYAILHEEVRTPRPFQYTSTLRLQNGVQIRNREDGAHWVYEASDAPAIHREPDGLPDNLRSASLMFSYVYTELPDQDPSTFWKEAARRIIGPFFKHMLIRPGRVRSRLAAIPGAGRSDPVARWKALYEYVRTTLRNRDELPAGGTPPPGGWKTNDDAADTLSHGDGTSGDLAAVYATLLRADGWNYRFILATDRTRRAFFPGIPSLSQFSTWLVEASNPAAPGQSAVVCLDSPMLPFGVVPWYYTDSQALAVDPEKGSEALVQLKSGSADLNAQDDDWLIVVGDDGSASLVKTNRYLGQPAIEQREEIYTKGEARIETEQKSAYARGAVPGELQSIAFDNAADPEKALLCHIRARLHGMVQAIPGGRIAVTPLALLEQTNPFLERDRTEPVILPYSFERRDTMKIAPPPGYTVDAPPAPVDLTTAAGRYAVQAQVDPDGGITLHRVFRLEHHTGPAESYSDFRRLYSDAAQGDAAGTVVFRRRPSPGGSR